MLEPDAGKLASPVLRGRRRSNALLLPDSKAGPARVRGVLYMAAVVAIKYNPHVKAVYARLLARGKSKMSALGACMRKLVHLCFGVLKTQKNYQAEYQNA
jgi:transposase